MRFPLMLLLFAAVVAAPPATGEDNSKQKKSSPATNGRHQTSTVQAKGSAGASKKLGSSNAVAQPGASKGQDLSTQDSDWETREISITKGNPTCEGDIKQNTKLSLGNNKEPNTDNEQIKVDAQTFEYTVQCNVDVQLVSERKTPLATFNIRFQKSCSVEECDATPNRNTQTDKYETKKVTAGPLVKDIKEDILREKAEPLLKEVEQYLTNEVIDMVQRTMEKHQRITNKMMQNYYEHYGEIQEEQPGEGQEDYAEEHEAEQ